MIAPPSGPTMYTQKSVHSDPISAGPKLRAVLSDEPLNGISATCAATSVSGIATRAVPACRSIADEWRMTSTKIAVASSSRNSAVPAPVGPGSVAVDATASWSNAMSTQSEPSTAPASCATQ